jgi:hypothetical protein
VRIDSPEPTTLALGIALAGLGFSPPQAAPSVLGAYGPRPRDGVFVSLLGERRVATLIVTDLPRWAPAETAGAREVAAPRQRADHNHLRG